MIVLERDGREHRIPTPDVTRRILWGMAGVALMIAVASRVVVRILRMSVKHWSQGQLFGKVLE